MSRSFSQWLWSALAVSVLVHGGLLAWIAGAPQSGIELAGGGGGGAAIGIAMAGAPDDAPGEAQAVNAVPEAPAKAEQPPQSPPDPAQPPRLAATHGEPAVRRAHAPLAREAAVDPASAAASAAPAIATEALPSAPHVSRDREAEPPPQHSRERPAAHRAASAGGRSGAPDASGGSGPADHPPGPGNAARDNYSGRVFRHLMRFRRPNVIGPGSAHVRFTVRDDGRVTNISVSRSSGSSRFDREAVRLVRRAAPFPAPPPGAGRDFNFKITGQ
ncbi:energy transducer TonB family protein [Stakelama tenebrarum]|uniref:TonB family protein n=1 Tax=Stakelama tenebrarum TaxID=2711215 RepID=A0A6G6Y2F7_9SPHN|nr:energy transducer TonB [Sphingosinithalassobacter tenebrarum]QIG78756.1 TonB family protein [Sphingosinithalassobacter tenebrarum]